MRGLPSDHPGALGTNRTRLPTGLLARSQHDDAPAGHGRGVVNIRPRPGEPLGQRRRSNIRTGGRALACQDDQPGNRADIGAGGARSQYCALVLPRLTLNAEAFENEFTDAAGVGLPAGGLHDCRRQWLRQPGPCRRGSSPPPPAGPPAPRRSLPAAPIVGDHGQAALLHNLFRAAFTGEHAVEHLAGQLVVDLSGLHQAVQFDHRLRAHAQLGRFNFGFLGPAGISPIHHLRATAAEAPAAMVSSIESITPALTTSRNSASE